MIIDIDTYSLMKYVVTAHQYIIVYLLYKKEYDELRTYLDITGFSNFESDVTYLITIGLLERYEYSIPLDIKGYYVTTKGLDLLAVKYLDLFDELLIEYPTKIIRPNGVTDFLKSDLTRCRVKYSKLIKNRRHIHDHILECLKFEVKHRTNTNSLQYMKKLPKWLDSEEWKAYEESINSNNSTIVEKGYGTELE